MIVGIQGEKGSANELAFNEFCNKYNLSNSTMKELVTTENVLRELNNGKIDYGVFAVSSSKGDVEESKLAMEKYSFEKVEELDLEINHVLLGLKKENKVFYDKVVSHPQALKERKDYLDKNWPDLKFMEEVNTATAARKLGERKYDDKTLVLALEECAFIYGLEVIDNKMKKYFAKFYLVKKK